MTGFTSSHCLMLTHLGIIFILSLVNGFFALSEMAVIAARKSRLKQMAKKSPRAKLAIALSEHPDLFLSAIQVGITITMLLTGAVAGATLSHSISHLLENIGFEWLVAYSATIGSIAGFILATFIQIVIGELVPKRIALSAPERLASFISYPMLIVAKVCSPFIWLLNVASSAILKLIRIDKVSRESISEEEIRLLVAESTEQGILDDDERNMVNRVLHLGDRNVDSLMTPRTRIVWLDMDASFADNLATLRETNHACYPVYRGSEDDVVGIIEVKRFINQVLISPTHEADLFASMSRPFYVPSSNRALDLLDDFRNNALNMALAVDEYGDIDGIITVSDVLGSVIGKPSATSLDEHDKTSDETDESFIVDGSLSTDDVRELLKLDHLPHEDEHEFHTLAGMMVTTFGRIPNEGEMFAWHGLSFEVLSIDGARIDKVRITPSESVDTGMEDDEDKQRYQETD